MTHSGDCDQCERAFDSHEGPPTPRRYWFSANDIARTLVKVGQGVSYRSAARSIREIAGRVPGGNPRDNIRHGQLAGDWTEVFAPVIFEHYRQELADQYGEVMADEGTLLIDEIPFFYKDNSRPGDRAQPHFMILAAAIATRHGVRLFKLEAFFNRDYTKREAWTEFLGSLPGRPSRIVCDEAQTITAVINDLWPGLEPFYCEWHRLERLRAWLIKGMAYQSNSSRPAQAKAGKQKIIEISAEAVRDEAAWHRMFNDTSTIREGLFRRFMTDHSGWYLDHIRRRPSAGEQRTTKPISIGALEEKLRVVRDIHISWRTHVLHNRERLNRLLMLVQLDVDEVANEREYTTIIRQWLEANGGRPAVARRAVV